MTSKFLVLAATVTLVACGAPAVSPPDGAVEFVVDGGRDSGVTGGPDAGITPPGSGGTTVTHDPGFGALRGSSGCNVVNPTCDPATEYLVTVSCHPDQDGGWYAVGGIAGAWCYALPTACQTNTTCNCLVESGGFNPDGGALACPGRYYFCIDGAGAKNLHCNPP